MRLGIFGGSFDPVHYGHLILAEQCLENLRLDRVVFVPTSISPHKTQGARANDRQRLEMLQLAIAGHPKFEISSLEVDRGGVSYTVETLEQFHADYPGAALFLLMGDDSLESFPKWKDPGRICELAIPVVVSRPGNGTVDLTPLESISGGERFGVIQASAFETRNVDISSTDIRQRVKENSSIRFLTPRSVEKYIETQKLYQGQ